MLSVGLVGVFLTSNMILFYFCWELMLVPAYFIVGEWGYRNCYKSALKLFIFTHAGAVFVLLGIGAIYWLTGSTDMFAAQAALMTAWHRYRQMDSNRLNRWIRSKNGSCSQSICGYLMHTQKLQHQCPHCSAVSSSAQELTQFCDYPSAWFSQQSLS